MEGQAKQPPAGWYADPEDAALQRFWDGTRWTNSRMPRGEAVPLEGEQPPSPPEPGRYASDSRFDPAVAQPPAGAMPPAAWYADPENPGGMRYWDGTRWTEHRTDYRAAEPKRPSEGMVVAGYAFSFLLPIVGVVLGLMLRGRGSPHGTPILVLSVLFFAIFMILGQTIETEP